MKLSLLLRKLFLSVITMLASTALAWATHLRAGEITVERVSCNSRTFRITITVFTNTVNTNVLFGGEDDWLDFGDGSEPHLVPEQENVLRPDLGVGIAMASYTFTHTYLADGSYTISYHEPNRNGGVLNMDASVNTRFYIETKIIIDPYRGCNNTPKLLVPPIDQACTGVAWFHNPGAYDPDGDSLSYRLVVPFRARSQEVINYQDPTAPKFYTNYSTGNEDGTDEPMFFINPVDGLITWDAPGTAGEYNIAFIIEEWRKIDGVWVTNGFVRRDMQVIVDECENERPDLEVPDDVCVEAGTTLTAVIRGTDSDGDPVKIEAFSEILNLAPAQSPASYTPADGEFIPSPAELHFEWTTTCEHVKEQPYQVVFKITDDSPTGSKLVTFKTWNIRVVGPAPQWVDAQTDLGDRAAVLEWDPYFCDNAEAMQIWRRVDSFPFEPDSCQTGMPDFLGYELVETLDLSDTPAVTYTDDNNGAGLNYGAQYCYRLVATFPAPRGGESYVSAEICIDPIRADVPVITNVSVDRTDPENGEVTVRWTKPFDIDRGQYPEIEYQVLRADGFTGTTNLTPVHPGHKAENDTVVVDDDEINTHGNIYNYRVVLWATTATDPGTFEAIDTSAAASTVRLEAAGGIGKITLNWSAIVPWSNIIQTEPNEHILYRGPEGADESAMVELATIDPTAGLTYVDDGLEETDTYCYRVLTRGAYGNPRILEPLENYSQIICAGVNDSIPPDCVLEVSIELSDCEGVTEEPCAGGIYENVISWNRPPLECAADLMGYRIYRATERDGNYTWMNWTGIVLDTFLIDRGPTGDGLRSRAYCYKVAAVDGSGNEGPLSEPMCNDNCPYYELPNVFTPGNRGSVVDCNDLFSAFSDRNFAGETGSEGCPTVEDAAKRCPRFVEQVNFKVYNRWGKQVYTYRSGGENTIYIDWNGRGDDGVDLTEGVYYYVAEVTFDAIEPSKRHQVIKGWVHLIR